LPLVLNPDKQGLEKVLRDYQIEALRMVWENSSGATSREVYLQVNDALKGTRSISRASIINFLNDMVDEGVLDYDEQTGKGGYHRVYKPKLDESSFKRYLAMTVLESLMKDFPHETREAIKAID